MLETLSTIPPGFLDAPARRVHECLRGPTLLHLAGVRERPLFVSALLHGNEDVGLQAVQRLLRRYADKPLPRALSVFVGNVTAAREGMRRLPDQPDFNRIWPGASQADTPEAEMMASVVEEMRARGVFASVDLHNNTGMNPHYACVNRLDHPFLQLATLFGRTVVYFLRPRGVQSMAFAALCPAVTLECGKVGDEGGVAHASEYLEACLNLSEIPKHQVASHDIDLFHTVATVKVPEAVSFSFAGEDSDLRLIPDIDRLNFRELPAGTVLGRAAMGKSGILDVWDESGRLVTERFLDFGNGEIRLKTAVMPSMLTCNTQVIRQDCLCYFMERYRFG